MLHTEFISQIEKHRAVLRKYTTVSGVVFYAKLALFFAMIITLFIIFANSFRAELLLTVFIEIMVMAALWFCHDRVRERIRRSNEIIAKNKRHIAGLSDMLSSYPAVESAALNSALAFIDDPAAAELLKSAGLADLPALSYSDYSAVVSPQERAYEFIDLPDYAKKSASRFLLM